MRVCSDFRSLMSLLSRSSGLRFRSLISSIAKPRRRPFSRESFPCFPTRLYAPDRAISFSLIPNPQFRLGATSLPTTAFDAGCASPRCLHPLLLIQMRLCTYLDDLLNNLQPSCVRGLDPDLKRQGSYISIVLLHSLSVFEVGRCVSKSFLLSSECIKSPPNLLSLLIP